MAWALGASSNSPPFAPAVGANAISTMRAAFFIGVFAGLGAVAQGGSISKTVGTELIRNTTITPLAAVAGLLTAAAFIAAGVRTGYPIPAAFAVTGAMVGVGLSKGGTPAWDTYRRVATFWAAVPPVSGTIAYGTARLLRSDAVSERVGVPLLGALVAGVLANVRMGVIPGPAAQNSVASAAVAAVGGPGGLVVAVAVTVAMAAAGFGVLRRGMADDVDRGIRRFLVGLGAIVAFSSGGSQVGLATGPLETPLSTLGVPGLALLALGGLGILAGAWMGSPRLLQAVSREYSTLGVRRSIAALVPGFLIAQTAILLGIPISFNNIVISSVVGSGLAAGSGGVSRGKILRTLAAWLATLVAAVATGFALYRVLALVPGAA
jgi:PiT family inorganic phosphate transporter